MICKECGAKIPDGAKFCGECGWVVDEKEAKKAEQKAKEAAKKKQRAESPVEILRLKRQVRKYRILTWVFAVLFALMMMAFAGANMDDTGGGGNVPDGGFALTGTYVVGEDTELPAGVYDIYSLDEYSADVKIYETMDDLKAEKQSDESTYMEWLYSKETKGFKLRDGYVLVIDEPGAMFVKR